MKIVFLGVRGSFPKSGKGFQKYGGDTSCIVIETESHILIFDAGTGIVNFNYNDYKRKPIFLFFTHYHYDHIIGFPFFLPFFMRKKIEIKIVGPQLGHLTPKKMVNLFMNQNFIPYTINEFKNIPEFSILKDKSILKLNKNLTITSHHIKEHPINGVIIYEIINKDKKIVIATDIEIKKSNEKKLQEIVKDAEILIMDSHFTEKDYQKVIRAGKEFGHSTFKKAIKIAEKANVNKLFFFHYNPQYNDKKIDEIKKSCIKEADFKNFYFTREGDNLRI